MSFSEEQVTLLHEILTQLTRGSDPRMLCRNKSYAPLMVAVASMKRRLVTPSAPRPRKPKPYDAAVVELADVTEDPFTVAGPAGIVSVAEDPGPATSES